jgi:predicted RNase H-like HicB family nuclease
MAGRRYTVVIEPDGDGHSVMVPSLPGCFSQGRTVEEAKANAAEAIAVHIEGLERSGEPVPEERDDDRPRLELVEVA